MFAPQNPLPDCLTRLLENPASRSFAPTPGDRRRGEAAPARRGAHDPLDAAILRGVVVAASLAVWAAILWLSLRHLLR